MPDYRKPPFEKASRPESASLPDDSGGFSIETTTMRLKSLKLRRAEAADRELDQQLREKSGRAPPAEANPGGRVRHDERGQAVWDMAVASGEFAALSATNVMRKLDVADLKIEETQRAMKLQVETGTRDAGGGSDPYNTRSNASTDPSKRGPIAGGGGDPYNQRSPAQSGAPTMKRPVPTAPVKKPGGSVLDQLTGRKK
jgi:hypothetical protein